MIVIILEVCVVWWISIDGFNRKLARGAKKSKERKETETRCDLCLNAKSSHSLGRIFAWMSAVGHREWSHSNGEYSNFESPFEIRPDRDRSSGEPEECRKQCPKIMIKPIRTVANAMR